MSRKRKILDILGMILGVRKWNDGRSGIYVPGRG